MLSWDCLINIGMEIYINSRRADERGTSVICRCDIVGVSDHGRSSLMPTYSFAEMVCLVVSECRIVGSRSFLPHADLRFAVLHVGRDLSRRKLLALFD
jgi:hypothetical protein